MGKKEKGYREVHSEPKNQISISIYPKESSDRRVCGLKGSATLCVNSMGISPLAQGFQIDYSNLSCDIMMPRALAI